ncbi:hypothetical protein DCAR_0832281 [Daucus carota subsp. sativus]|uniref:Uncharacterized protein n=1 Tax=Daucus carota subsp. sativus TaxID=79200 RepID=A0AAF1BCD7_DAUCS|nr:hypothetical protein DCAR_0832281 [Daucus carota subsp. sativus]
MASKVIKTVAKSVGVYQMIFQKGVWGYWHLCAWKHSGIKVLLAGEDWHNDPERKDVDWHN